MKKCYVKLDENNIVKQKQYYNEDGFIEVDDNVTCGMLLNEDKTFSIPERDIEQIRIDKKQELTNAFNLESIKPVEVNSISYNGGFESAIKLDAAKRLNETAGLTEVSFYGIDNKPNVLSIGDATVVIMTIANKFQTDLAKYQSLKVELAGKKLVNTIEALSW